MSRELRVGAGKHTKKIVVVHFPLIWHSRSHLPKKLDYLDENCPSNRANQILDPNIKIKILQRPNIFMWGVFPEAMDWNVGAVCSDFNLGERIWR